MFALFNAIDSACALLPDWARLVIYGLILGVVSMLIYWKLSPQDRINATKQELDAAQKALRAYNGTDIRQMLKLCSAAIAASGRRLMLVLGPTLIATLPVLAVLTWIETDFSARQPAAGDTVRATIIGDGLGIQNAVRWTPAAAVATGATPATSAVTWPDATAPLRLVNADDGQEIFRLPMNRPLRDVHKPTWWWTLLAGHDRPELAPAAACSQVEFDLPPRQFWLIGPQWLRGWETPVFLALTIAVVAMKYILKVN